MSFRLAVNQDQAQHTGLVAFGAKRKVWCGEGGPPQLEVQCLALGTRAQGGVFDLLKVFMGCTGPLLKSLEPSLRLCLYGWAVWRASPGNGHMIGSGWVALEKMTSSFPATDWIHLCLRAIMLLCGDALIVCFWKAISSQWVKLSLEWWLFQI